jgi:amino acid transporter
LRGSTSAFFGYLGYDEVCCLAAEAKDPQRVLPQAVFGTIGTVTVLYSLAALALAGML